MGKSVAELTEAALELTRRPGKQAWPVISAIEQVTQGCSTRTRRAVQARVLDRLREDEAREAARIQVNYHHLTKEQ
jgi:hypothetical protein